MRSVDRDFPSRGFELTPHLSWGLEKGNSSPTVSSRWPTCFGEFRSQFTINWRGRYHTFDGRIRFDFGRGQRWYISYMAVLGCTALDSRSTRTPHPILSHRDLHTRMRMAHYRAHACRSSPRMLPAPPSTDTIRTFSIRRNKVRLRTFVLSWFSMPLTVPSLERVFVWRAPQPSLGSQELPCNMRMVGKPGTGWIMFSLITMCDLMSLGIRHEFVCNGHRFVSWEAAVRNLRKIHNQLVFSPLPLSRN